MVYDSVVSAVTANGAKGAVLNIPDVTSIPFFTTIPFNGLMLDSLQALQLNGLYQGSGMQFQAGANAFVIQDVSLPSGRRQLKAGELVLLSLSQDSLKCAGWGTVKPIPEQFVLTQDELTRIAAATLAFNTIIHDVALLNNLPVVDMNAYLRTAVTGIKYNGVTFNTQYLSGGAFSLDGIHLTPRGYALVANEIIRVVNAYYKSTIPAVDANAYSGIRFPL